MADYKTSVGNVQIISLTDGQGNLSPLDMFPESTMEQWRAEFPGELDKDEHLNPRYGCCALRSGTKLIVVDTGMDGVLIKDLRQKGIYLEAVDFVVLTHMHPDHVGWNLTNGRPTFPQARYIAHQADWDHWTQPSVLEEAPFVRDQVMPLKELGILDLIDGEHKLTDELTIVHTPGHTPGHVSIAISSAGEKGHILGDVAHSIAQAHHTGWSPVFDVDGDLARKTRQQVFDHLEAEGTLISAGHFPDPGFGTLVQSGDRRVWSPS